MSLRSQIQLEGFNMQVNKLSSATMAAAAAMLFMSGFATVSFAADAALVQCSGVKSCKGMSECKSAHNSCKGMNSCKGQGWVSMSKAECKEAKAKAGK
ncbi:MAG: BufA2 family periplasmic bufferin-type metallophore [Gammaproteobacteria bacterium]